MFIVCDRTPEVMPTGLKSTSSPIQVSASITETTGGTFSFDQIDLTLNPLDNEVFVITQVNLDVDVPDLPTGSGDQNFVSASLSATQRTGVGSIANENVIASAQRYVGTTSVAGVPISFMFAREDPNFVAQDLDYLFIVATNNMFLNVQSEGAITTNPKTARVRVYGYRATASASVYAALVQSELLSS